MMGMLVFVLWWCFFFFVCVLGLFVCLFHLFACGFFGVFVCLGGGCGFLCFGFFFFNWEKKLKTDVLRGRFEGINSWIFH